MKTYIFLLEISSKIFHETNEISSEKYKATSGKSIWSFYSISSLICSLLVEIVSIEIIQNFQNENGNERNAKMYSLQRET